MLLQLRKKNEEQTLYDLPEEYLRIEYPEEWKRLTKMKLIDKLLIP